MKGKVFTAQEVQAIIAGNKTQFREVCLFQPTNELAIDALLRLYKPYGIGQKIFCKESFWQFGGYDGGSDGDEARFIGSNKITFCPEEATKPQTLCKGWKKRPAQHMKQEQSRLTLLIKSVGVERLADISEEDCKKEGIGYTGGWNGVDYYEDDGEFYFGKLTKSEDGMNEMFEYPDLAFASIWNATHKKPEEKFEANPWVWVVDFKINK